MTLKCLLLWRDNYTLFLLSSEWKSIIWTESVYSSLKSTSHSLNKDTSCTLFKLAEINSYIWKGSKVEVFRDVSVSWGDLCSAVIGPASCRSHCCFITVCPWPRDPPAFICTSVRTPPSLLRGQASVGLTHTHTHITPLTSWVLGQATGLRYELELNQQKYFYCIFSILTFFYFAFFPPLSYELTSANVIFNLILCIIFWFSLPL